MLIPFPTAGSRWRGAKEPAGVSSYAGEKWAAPHRPAILAEGFGGAMISGTVERQLRGQLEREWTPDGLLVIVRVPDQIEAANLE